MALLGAWRNGSISGAPTAQNTSGVARSVSANGVQYVNLLNVVKAATNDFSFAYMEFIETPTFTREVLTLLSDEEYRGLQNELVADPERGNLIKGGGGIRKLRYATSGRGKSGGVRTIYYFKSADDLIYMLVVYPKSKKDNLSPKEIEQLRKLVKEL